MGAAPRRAAQAAAWVWVVAALAAYLAQFRDIAAALLGR